MLSDQNTPIIIVHYHMDAGGVTQVILNQIKVLQSTDQPYLLLTGKEYSGDLGLCQEVIPELNYKDAADDHTAEAESLFSKCIQAASTRFGLSEAVWHFHNPTLGKNVLYPRLIELLSQTKETILLQCHDLAEDGRSKNHQRNLQSGRIYPLAPNIHYAFVNSRDKRALQRAGINPQQLHLLSNTISESAHKHQPNPLSPPLVVYPVRGIRRKNLGEFLLWSVLAPQGSTFALTLQPQNPEWLSLYQLWEELADDLQLPVIMNCIGQDAPGGGGSDFPHWMAAATHCITTSIAEGFGLTFLEPLSQNIPLIGRDLPEITEDLDLQSTPNTKLYERLLVPLDTLDAQELKNLFTQEISAQYRAYGREVTAAEIETSWALLTDGQMVDFGNLPELLQIYYIIRAKVDGFREFSVELGGGQRIDATDWITAALVPNYSHPLTQNVMLYDHTPEAYRDRYLSILEQLHSSTKTLPSWLPPNNVLEQYLRPERFHFLMS